MLGLLRRHSTVRLVVAILSILALTSPAAARMQSAPDTALSVLVD